jgi:recombinational DNA repair ATPase RecF
MTQRELEELKESADQGALTKREQKRLITVCEELMQQRAEYYALLYDVHRQIKEVIPSLSRAQKSDITGSRYSQEP